MIEFIPYSPVFFHLQNRTSSAPSVSAHFFAGSTPALRLPIGSLKVDAANQRPPEKIQHCTRAIVIVRLDLLTTVKSQPPLLDEGAGVEPTS
jgi:hypothetical protein